MVPNDVISLPVRAPMDCTKLSTEQLNRRTRESETLKACSGTIREETIAQLRNRHKCGGLLRPDGATRAEEDRKDKKKRQCAEAGTHPESGPVANDSGTGACSEEIDRDTGEQGTDKHTDPICHESVEALCGVA